MTNHILTIVIALLFASSSFSVNAVTCNKADSAAFVAFMESFHFTPPTSDCCSYEYVQCDRTGRVTSLNLDNDNFGYLNGTIPAVLGDLTALKQIRFADMPALVGPIPPQITKLKKLQRLEISDCQITGPVPSFLSQLPSLQTLELRKNKLVGTIPPSLGDLVHLSWLSLYNNQLTGTIPPNLFSKLPKPNTVFLYLSSNNFEGTVPQSFADVNFDDCYLDDNKLTGDLSLLFGRNKTITSISVAFNNFSFDLTKVVYPLGLTYLDISRNQIYGSISNQITELPNLTAVSFSYNDLCGKIPSGGHFRTFDASAFEHNKCLCGAPLQPCK